MTSYYHPINCYRTSSKCKAFIGGSSSESDQVAIFLQYCKQMYFNRKKILTFMAMTIDQVSMIPISSEQYFEDILFLN